MLSRFDEYPIHQTPQPIAHPATTDRNAYDRFWFNGYVEDGAFYFGIALGLYPNRQIMDGAFSIVHDGQQHCFFASRRAPADRDEIEVGPLKIEVVDPMRRIRVTLAGNDTGLTCDLMFEAVSAPIEEDRQILERDDRVFMDVTRFTQFGRWHGTIGCKGKTIPVDRGRTFATRDRSWGVRPVGEPESGGAPPRSAPQLYFLWAPVQWGDFATHCCIFEDSEGCRLHGESRIAPCHPGRAGADQSKPQRHDPGLQTMAATAHQIDYAPGTRRARAAQIRMTDTKGAAKELHFEPLLTFQMKGIGYRHPEWNHGRWKGELAAGGESYPCGQLDPLALENVHVQQLVRVTMDGRTGYGALEQVCVGPHAPSGFKRFLDGAA